MHQKKILTAALVASTVAGIGIVPAQNAEAASISSFVSNALAIANDNSHGYSMVNRWGPDYDCSSFVITCLKQAGFETGGATYSGNMVSNLTQHGFSYIPSSKIDLNSSSSLQAGDILMASGHTEIYIGNGKRVGAHRNYDGKTGDSGGNEINVLNYTRGSWYGILRYTGSGSTATAVTTAATTTSSSETGTYKINANLNLRSGNSTSTSIMTTIPKGSSVTVSQISNGWGKTTYSGKTGWIYLSYATRTGNAATTAAATTTPAATTTTAAATGAIYKTTANLNMRTGNSTGYSRLLTIPRGTSVTVTETKGGWGKTSYSGKTGWISLDYATKTGNVAAPAATTTVASTASASSAVAGTVYKTNGNMYLRSGNNKSASILGVVPKGTSVTATQISNNWGKITYGGKTGWMSLKYSTKTGTVAAPAASTAKATTASSTKTASAASPTVTGTTSKTTSFIYQTTSNLNLRSGNSTSYSKLSVIPRGTGVTVTEVKNNWGKVSYDGKTGWISLQYASKKGSNVVTTINTVVKNAASSSTKTVTYSYMTTANLNLRKSFSTASAKILTMPKGTSLTVTEIKNNWGKVNYQGNVGWMSLQYAICTGSQTTIKNIIGQTSASPTLKTASVPATASAVKTASVPAATSSVKLTASATPVTTIAKAAASVSLASAAETTAEAKSDQGQSENEETKPVSFSMPVSVVNALEDEAKTSEAEEAVEETATEEVKAEEAVAEETAENDVAVEETAAPEETVEAVEEAAEAESEETEAEDAEETEEETPDAEAEESEESVEAETSEAEETDVEAEAEEETAVEEAEVEEEADVEDAEVEETADAFAAGNYAAQNEIRIFADAYDGAEVLTTFEAGTVLEVTAENDGWGKVSIDGQTCWIHLADVEKTEASVSKGLTLQADTQDAEAETENAEAESTDEQTAEDGGASELMEDQAE
ncbi:MAG: SH3 domain-containing protein [Eubacterium sp.]|nr:SH3 domain-containing protein [Eubacterium sp.]